LISPIWHASRSAQHEPLDIGETSDLRPRDVAHICVHADSHRSLEKIEKIGPLAHYESDAQPYGCTASTRSKSTRDFERAATLADARAAWLDRLAKVENAIA
jgi:hypothetical protein